MDRWTAYIDSILVKHTRVNIIHQVALLFNKAKLITDFVEIKCTSIEI